MQFKNSVFNNKYLYLLLSLIAYFISMAYLVDHRIEGAIHAFTFSLVILFSVYSIAHRKIILLIGLTLGLITFFENWYSNLLGSDVKFDTINYITSILFLATITFSVIENLLSHKKVTIDTLLGAICGYILIGFIWTFLYLLIATIHPDAFSGITQTEVYHQKLQHFAYYSFVTLTTLGYGDIVSVSSMARTLSWVEAIVGQAYLTIWIAQLVGLHIVNKHKES
jgi:voltage-gated potassium channel